MSSRALRETRRSFSSPAAWPPTPIWSNPACGARWEGHREAASERLSAETRGVVARRQRSAFRLGVPANNLWTLWQGLGLRMDLAVAHAAAHRLADRHRPD